MLCIVNWTIVPIKLLPKYSKDVYLRHKLQVNLFENGIITLGLL